MRVALHDVCMYWCQYYQVQNNQGRLGTEWFVAQVSLFRRCGRWRLWKT